MNQILSQSVTGLEFMSRNLYFLFLVTDDILVLRDPERVSLDQNDQIRLTVERQTEQSLDFCLLRLNLGE